MKVIALACALALSASPVGAQTVAFPLISSGAFGWPLEDAVHQALTALRSAQTGVELARLVLFGPSTLAIAQRVAGSAGPGCPARDGSKPRCGATPAGRIPNGWPRGQIPRQFGRARGRLQLLGFRSYVVGRNCHATPSWIA